MKVTPDNITALADNEVFVFGSNESGRHGKGAAKTAMKWGAIYGNPEGLQGQTYALPTVNARITKPLQIITITRYVNRFIDFAESRPDLYFLVTEVGCGLAGLKPIDIAPLFRRAQHLSNVALPQRFHDLLFY